MLGAVAYAERQMRQFTSPFEVEEVERVGQMIAESGDGLPDQRVLMCDNPFWVKKWTTFGVS